MSRSRHTGAQIIGALKQVEAGQAAEQVARQHGVSKYTIYAWKAKYGGMEVSEAREVKQLRDENARLKRLLAEYAISQRHACELMEIPRSTHRYQSRKDDAPLRERLTALAQQRPRFGCRRLQVLLRREGVGVNHKRVQRVYRAAGLTVKRLRRRRLARAAVPHPALTAPNQEWAIDFVSDVTHARQRMRILSVVDAYTRECLTLEVDTSFPSRRVTRVLERLMASLGRPAGLRSDNGPELTSRHYLAWCLEQKVQAIHIQPGRPMQNGHVESFNGRLRDECLNASWFWNLRDARRKIAA